MHSRLYLVFYACIVVGCAGEVSNSTSNNPQPRRPLFASGSPEQATLDRFLAKYPPEKAERLLRYFETGEKVVASVDPNSQRDIDAIYAALQAQRANERPRLNHYVPGPVEEALIQDYLKRVSPGDYEVARAALYSSNAHIRAHDPEDQKLLDAIYKARRESIDGLKSRR